MPSSVLILVALLILQPGSAWACAACYGQSDSPLAVGMNWGIFTLLGTIVMVLVGVATFFIYLARRAAASAEASVVQPALEPVGSAAE